MPATSIVSPPSSRTSGVYGRKVIVGGVKRFGSSSRDRSPVRHEHLRSGPLGELCDTHEVVPVAVRHEDCRARRPEPRQLEP